MNASENDYQRQRGKRCRSKQRRIRIRIDEDEEGEETKQFLDDFTFRNAYVREFVHLRVCAFFMLQQHVDLAKKNKVMMIKEYIALYMQMNVYVLASCN